MGVELFYRSEIAYLSLNAMVVRGLMNSNKELFYH